MQDSPPNARTATATADNEHHGGDEAGNIWMVIVSIGLLLLLASLDQTIVSTALPTIVADLGGVEHLSWVVTAYILASTIVAPLYGKLGDLYGRRNMVFVSVTLFLAGSILSGMATSMTFLIAARALQGLGGGGLFVLALSVVGDAIPPQDRGKVQGLFAAVFSVSSVLGPLMGGWFVDVASWHWIFYINMPVGALALAGFALSFKPTGRRTQHKIDWAGAATLSVALASLTLFTSLGGRSFAWDSAASVALAGLALVATVAFIMVERRATEPLIPLALFNNNVFSVTSAISFIAGAAMFGAATFLPLYMQIARGATPTQSGLMMIPMMAGILVSSNLSGRYMSRTGRYKILPLIGTTLLTIGMLLLSRIEADSPLWVVFASMVPVGLGMGGIFPVVTTAVQAAVPRPQLGTATAAGLMFRQVGGSLSVAVFGAIFAARLGLEAMGVSSESLSPELLSHLPAEVQASVGDRIVHALSPIFIIAAGLGVTGFVFSTRLKEVLLHNRMVRTTAE